MPWIRFGKAVSWHPSTDVGFRILRATRIRTTTDYSLSQVMTTDKLETFASTVRPWHRRIGPGLITACVVIGPGSVLTSFQDRRGTRLRALLGSCLGRCLHVGVYQFRRQVGCRGHRNRRGRLWLDVPDDGWPCSWGWACSLFPPRFSFGNNLGVDAAARALNVRS